MRKVLVLLLTTFVLLTAIVFAADPIILRFYFPVGVAGPLARYMGELADEFNKTHPDIIVEPIYSGGYIETLQRALTASKAGNPPDVALLTAADIWTAVDEGIVISLEEYVESEGGDTFLEPYFDAFLADCTVVGELYALPFQKSTPIFYYNKDMFREAGLDPDKPPTTWAELKDYASKLAIKQGNETVRWGVQIPIDQWLLSAFIMQNGGLVNNEAGTETYLNSQEAIGALEFMRSLVAEGLMPARRLFGDSSADFVAGATAMMYNSTGSLAFVRESASFEWGVAYLPGNVRRAVPTGGGQFVIMAGIPEARQKASWEFIKWMTAPEQAATWSMKTGYVAVREDAFGIPAMEEYVQGFPFALVARDQLQFVLVGEPPATHGARQISRFMTDALEAAIAGRLTPKDALDSAQAEAERVLRPYR